MIRFIGIILLSLGALLSCGLEEVYYIDYIQRKEYNDTNAVISLPSSSAEGYAYFDNFIIFYRIYISASNETPGRHLEGNGVNTVRSAISSALHSDYNGLYTLTDITSTTVSTTNLENTFSNRKFFLLTLEDADIDSVLGSPSLGQSLYIAFSPVSGEPPTLTVNGNSYVLQRAIKNENLNLYDLNPLPNRSFFNHRDLYDTANITNGRNNDVATNSGANLENTYISLYIAARGTSLQMPPVTIYSQPTFIGIFRLANSG